MEIIIDKKQLKKVIKEVQLEIINDITNNNVFIITELIVTLFMCFYFINYFWFNILQFNPIL